MSAPWFRQYEQAAGLYAPSVLDVVRESGLDVEALLQHVGQMPGAQVRRYPDGTAQVEGPGACEAFENGGGGYFHQRANQLLNQADDYVRAKTLVGGTSYSSLAPFPPKMHVLWVWGEFVKQWTNGAITVGTAKTALTEYAGARIPEAPIDDLLVSAAFKRRLSNAARERFSVLIARWFESVRAEGMFGEGPVVPASGEIHFYKRLAQLRIDASRSGQNTVNWLILSLIQICPHHLMTEVFFTLEPFVNTSFEEYYQLSKDKRIAFPIPKTSAVPGIGETSERMDEHPVERARNAADEPARSSHVPTHAEAYRAVDSPHFRVLITPWSETDSLAVKVYFEQLPRPVDRRAFAESIVRWLRLGSEGGFGGNGFHYFEEPEYDEQTDSVRFCCDMGTADVRLAIRVLVNTLESWHTQGGLAINAVVLGERSREAQ